MKPLVSIVMPVYNAEKYLEAAIDSIVKQTYGKYELIIVDDHSTDNSWKIIKNYAQRYPEKITSIVKLRKNTNAAGNGAMDAVFDKLKGKYIARMDADDIAHSQRIEKQVIFMERHPKTIVLGTQGVVIDTKDTIVGMKNFPTKPKDIYREYFIFHPILHPSIMIRKSLLPSKNHIYENVWGVNDDYYTFLKWLNYGEFYNLPDALHYYRIHGNNFSLQNPKKLFSNSIQIRFEAVNKFGYRPTIKGWFLLFVQIIIVKIIPEKYIVPVYKLVKGINKPSLFEIRNLFSQANSPRSSYLRT